MPKVIDVIYENGVLKPLDKVELREKRKYRVSITESKEDTIKSYRGCSKRVDVHYM
ncbi:MAG: antitoxin family protein [Halobacteriota archaeon]